MAGSTTVREVSATLSGKGRVVVPAEVRKRLGLAQGSVLRFVLDEDGVRLLPAAGDVQRLKGRLPAPAQPVTLEDLEATIAQRRARIGGSTQR